MNNSDLAIEASRKALDAAGITAEEIDLIIVSTITPDMVFPATACLVQHAIGAKHAATFDLEAACSGFIYGLSVARQYIATGECTNVLVVASEVLSRITDWTDRSTCVLFGDGAGAAILSASDEGDSDFCRSSWEETGNTVTSSTCPQVAPANRPVTKPWMPGNIP